MKKINRAASVQMSFPLCNFLVLNLSQIMFLHINLIRLSAVKYPISHIYKKKRTRKMLMMAWFSSILCSLPQSYYFTLKQHPLDVEYEQCTTIGNFSTQIEVSTVPLLPRTFFVSCLSPVFILVPQFSS